MYADDLMISAESMEELLINSKTGKSEMEKKCLRMNMRKTKITVSAINLDLLKKYGNDLCGICLTGAGNTSIFCGGCLCWTNNTRGPMVCKRSHDIWAYCKYKNKFCQI